jgi:hypothetical protein
MSAFRYLSSRKSAWPIGALSCPVVIDHVSLAGSKYVRRRRRLAAIALDRAARALLMLIVGVGPAIAASVQSPAIDLSRHQIGAPQQQFEFWRAGQADLGLGAEAAR